MRRIIYGYFTFDDPDEGPTDWHRRLHAALAREALEDRCVLRLAGVTVEGRLVLQEVDAALWPDMAAPDQRREPRTMLEAIRAAERDDEDEPLPF